MSESAAKQSPLERIVPWLGKMSAMGAMALITLATIQEVVLDVGVQGLTGAIRKALSGLFGDAVIGPAIDRLLGTGGEAISEDLQADLSRLEELLRRQDVRRDVAELLRKQNAIARVTGTALQMHEDSAVQRIAEAVAYQTWAAADDVVRRVGDELQRALQDAGLQDLHATVQAMMALLKRERGLTIYVHQTTSNAEQVIRISAIYGNVTIHNYAQQKLVRGEADPTPLLRHYLQVLFHRLQRLPLSQIAPDARHSEQVALPALYTPLDVWIHPEQLDKQSWSLPFGLAQEAGRYRAPALEAVENYHHCVLAGDPGSGKSTFAHFLVVCMAGAMLGEAVNIDVLNQTALRGLEDEDKVTGPSWTTPLWKQGILLPLYVELRQFALSDDFQAGGGQGRADNLLRFLKHEHEMDERVMPVVIGALETDSGAGVLIVLDGLDEVAEAEQRRQRLKAIIEDLATVYPKARILVTSRTYAYQSGSPWRLAGDFEVAELAPYNQRQIALYVRRWYDEALQRSTAAHREWADELIARIGQERHLRDLAERPLLLTMMTLLHDAQGGRLPPGGRTALYDETVKLLVQRWNQATKQETPLTEELGLTLEELSEALEKLAFSAHSKQALNVSTAADIALGELYAALDSIRLEGDSPGWDYRSVSRKLHYRAGILVADSDTIYRFPHRSFQEYLAACGLVRHAYDLDMPAEAGQSPDEAEGWCFPDNLARLLALEPDRWREVTLLAAGRVVASKADDAWDLVEALSEAGAIADRPGSLLHWSRLLAGQILVEHSLHERPRRGSHHRILEAVRDRLVRLAETGALPPVDRAQAGRVLAVLGDSRKGVGLNTDGLPDIDWVPIPAGEFWMGSDKAKDPHARDRELPQHKVYLEAFEIARYPVTYAQYEVFVHDTSEHPEGGYAINRYWTEAGLAWREQKRHPDWDWHDPRWHIANHPVVGLTWFEAYAFCTWLSEKTGKDIRLPTEMQWEKAARSEDGRIYPYGDTFDPNKGNSRETGIGRTTAVGLFPDPALPYGLLDMSGNASEWCASKWRKSYSEGEENNNPEGREMRVLRGGAFNKEPHEVRAAYLYMDSPDGRDGYFGFRCVRLNRLYGLGTS